MISIDIRNILMYTYFRSKNKAYIRKEFLT